MAMIKHGIKIKRTAKTMSATAIHIKIPNMPIRMVTKNAPINAIGKLYIYFLIIAIFFIFSQNCKENPFIFIIKIATIIVWLLAISFKLSLMEVSS